MDSVPSAQLAPPSQDSPLLAEARDLDARLRQRATTRKRNCALDAFDLARCKRLELFRLLGYASITAYAYSVNGFGSSKTSEDKNLGPTTAHWVSSAWRSSVGWRRFATRSATSAAPSPSARRSPRRAGGWQWGRL